MVSGAKLNWWLNFIFFQGIWFAAILGAANNNLFWCYGLFAVFLVYQLWPTNRKPGDCLNIIVLLVLGFVADSIWAYTGIIEYQSHISWFKTAPNWILILWVTFGLSLNHSMVWIYKKPWLAYLFGGIGGPLSYFAGERLGAISIPLPLLAAVSLAVCWLGVMWMVQKLREWNYSNLFQWFGVRKPHA